MSYQTGHTIKKTLDAVHRQELVLPAIQREFVWQPRQICGLFDSLMQGYPFGTFLYWNVQPENSGEYTYYNFVQNYHETRNPYASSYTPMPRQRLTAVLDGQQRLTALNIGFRGSMAWKLPYRRHDDPTAYPERHLHLDLLWEPEEDEEGRKYRFRFLTKDDLKKADANECWFSVSKILSMTSPPEMHAWLTKQPSEEARTRGLGPLWRLYQMAHEDQIVAYYQEDSQELEKVLQIFIRMNSGGTPLSYSDLLLSVAVAAFKDHDARKEIRSLVRDIRYDGRFSFSKDWVLKAGLMLSDVGSVGFKVANFNNQNMTILEGEWLGIKDSLVRAVRLIARFGFNSRTLRADSAVLPIAYYIHTRGHTDNFLTGNGYREDRDAIRDWLVRSIVKASGIWGSGLDTLLTALRDVISDSSGPFPTTDINREMARRGRSLTFEPEEIDDLADIKYGNPRTFALLSLLCPFVDVESTVFHIDHVFPKARFTKIRLRKAGLPDDDDELDNIIDCRDRLANLQLLAAPDHGTKGTMMPANWLNEMLDQKRQLHCELHKLGDVPTEMTDFMSFYNTRRAVLRDEIAKLLGTTSR